MAPIYAASALLLFTLPHSFAVPVDQDPIAPPLSPPVGPFPGPAPLDVSSLTGGVLNSPDIIEEPFPLDPGIGDGTFPGEPAPIPIEPGIGDGTGPEAFGTPATSDLAVPTDVVSTIIDVILSDPVPSSLDPALPTLTLDTTGATDSSTPEIIKDPLLLPPDQQTAENAIVPPQTLSVDSFLSIVQQLADVISGFFTIQPGRPAPPIGIVPSDIISSFEASATPSPPIVAPPPFVPPVPLPAPIFPIDKIGTIFKSLKKRDLSVAQNELLSQIAAKNVELQNAINALRRIQAGQLGIQKRDADSDVSVGTQTITSLVSDIIDLLTQMVADGQTPAADTGKPVARSDPLPMGELLNSFGGLGGPPNIASVIDKASKSTEVVKSALASASSVIDGAMPVVAAGKSSNATKSISSTLKPVTETVPMVPLTVVQKLLTLIIDLLPKAFTSKQNAITTRSEMAAVFSAASKKPKPASLSSIYATLADLLSPSEAAKALQAAFDALSPASQAILLLSLGPGPVIPDLKLTPPKQISKRDAQFDIIAQVKDFIKRWHTIGVSLSSTDPKLVTSLMKVFHDPSIDPSTYPSLGKYPDSVRNFVMQYFVLAQILIDAGVPADDKVQLLKLLFDGTPEAIRKRAVSKRDDKPEWNENKVKDFIKLFWKIDPLIQSLDPAAVDKLSAPFTGGSHHEASWGKGKDKDTEVKNAAIQYAKFREFLLSLDDDDKTSLEQILTAGQLPVKRSMRHGLRRRQYEGYEKPDLGPKLSDIPKLGAKLTKILGPAGTLDPMGMTDPYPDATKPFYDTKSNHLKPNPNAGYSEYEPESNEYVGDYEDADDAADEFWDPYSQIDTQAGEYGDVSAGAPENWK